MAIGSSSKVFITAVPSDIQEPRRWYLQNSLELPPPWISYSSFISADMVAHLMRNKKTSAIGVKFEPENHIPDRITNMEGALHTFVNPIVEATIHGDYQWTGGHSIFRFGSKEGKLLGRKVLVSALVQQDFENESVMVQVASVREKESIGSAQAPSLLSISDKQDDEKRREYDEKLRLFLVYYLVASHKLPSLLAVQRDAMTIKEALNFWGEIIENCEPESMRSRVQNQFMRCNQSYLSLEVMFSTAVHQITNEFRLLEVMCKENGHVYTFNPPAIFVRFFDGYGRSYQGTELLSRIHIAALKLYASSSTMAACRCVAWSDFSSKTTIPLLKLALITQPHIEVRSRDDVFCKTRLATDQSDGLYLPPDHAMESVLVIHNNSDAFGQNIESEWAGGSLDGVIGVFSSTSGSLLRDRKDLCDGMVVVV